MITIKQIARNLGLSHSTVSRALNDHPSISRATKNRVHAEAAKHGYIVNQAANAMKGGHTSSVGLLIPDIDNAFYAKLTSRLSEIFRAENTNLILSVTGENPEHEEFSIQQLVSLRPRAIFAVPSPAMTQRAEAVFRDNNVVQLIRRSDRLPELSFIGIDEISGICEATRHLYRQGHRRVGYFGRALDVSTGVERLQGFEKGCRECGLDIPPEYVVLSPSDFDQAKILVDRMLSDNPITGLVVGGELLTQAVWSYVLDRGLEVPGQLAVVGYGDFDWVRTIQRPGEKLRLPLAEIAKSCSRFVNGDDMRRAPEEIRHAPGIG